MLEGLCKELDRLSLKKISQKYKFLGEGIARKVYAIDDKYVVKISKGIDGFYQNSVENYIYTKASDELKTILCPIEYFSKKYLIMKRAIPMSTLTNKRYIDVSKFNGYNHLKDFMNILVGKFFLLEEDLYSPTSWGYLDNKLCLIDYGCTTDYGDFYYDFILTLNKIDNYFKK